MRHYNDELVKQVRFIHKNQGLSYLQLSKKFGVPSGTLRNWCHEDGLSRKNAISRTYQAKRDFFKKSEIACAPSLNSISKKEAKLLTGLLYGCEGSKYPASSRLDFTNSDPDLIATFVRLLRKGFVVDPKKIRLRLQIHSDQSFDKLKKFWTKTIGLDNIRFMKPTITSPLGRKHRPIYHGTCTVRYNDYSLQLKLLGIFEKFVKN